MLLSPVRQSDRTSSIDVLKGLAVLGMLVMGIQRFSLPEATYVNPTSFETLGGMQLYIWLVSHILFDQKFMSIFAILFGAGIIMLSNQAKKEHTRSGAIQRRRIFWLLVIGVFHAYLLWYGDVLVAYALCGLLMFSLRHKKSKTLFRTGFLLVAMGSVISISMGYILPYLNASTFQAMEQDLWLPNTKVIVEEISIYTSNWERQMLARVPMTIEIQTRIFAMDHFWKVSGLILVGMGFSKKRALKAKQSDKFYFKMIGYGIGVGLPLVLVGTLLHFNYEWDFQYSYFYFPQLNYWGSALMAIGYMGIVLFFMKHTNETYLTKRLADVGRMSLTNYLLQSVLCSFIFYGHGLGLYGDLDRGAQLLVAAGIWAFQILFSSVWLTYFRFGPFEWLWKSLYYQKIQPFYIQR